MKSHLSYNRLFALLYDIKVKHKYKVEHKSSETLEVELYVYKLFKFFATQVFP